MSEGTGGLVKLVLGVLKDISRRIDQTMLKYDKSIKDYESFVESSDGYGFRSLVVPSVVVRHVAPIAKTPVAGVAGFPHGYQPVEAKAKEIEAIAEGGGKEVDVVVNIVNLKSGLISSVKDELSTLTNLAHQLGLGIKFIVETSALSDDELRMIAELVLESGADFIKTNTGYGRRGVWLRDILLIRSVVGGKLKVKASGGIRNSVDAALLVLAGADVLGTSSGIQIVEDSRKVAEILESSGIRP